MGRAVEVLEGFAEARVRARLGTVAIEGGRVDEDAARGRDGFSFGGDAEGVGAAAVAAGSTGGRGATGAACASATALTRRAAGTGTSCGFSSLVPARSVVAEVETTETRYVYTD
jgi:hypothetical protein